VRNNAKSPLNWLEHRVADVATSTPMVTPGERYVKHLEIAVRDSDMTVQLFTYTGEMQMNRVRDHLLAICRKKTRPGRHLPVLLYRRDRQWFGDSMVTMPLWVLGALINGTASQQDWEPETGRGTRFYARYPFPPDDTEAEGIGTTNPEAFTISPEERHSNVAVRPGARRPTDRSSGDKSKVVAFPATGVRHPHPSGKGLRASLEALEVTNNKGEK
jgi:hypothetical protein